MTTEAKQNHTPTPWSIEKCFGIYGCPQEHDAQGTLMIADTIIDDEGRFVGKMGDLPLIVLAVNSHAAMVEALRKNLAMMEKINTAFFVTGKRSALQAAMEGQRDLLAETRAALASLD